MKYMSPNDMFKKSCDLMIEGRQPASHRDWSLLVNCWAVNVASAEVELCLLMKLMYDCPLTDKEITDIAQYQINLKRKAS